MIHYVFAKPGFFETMRMPLLEGRYFDSRDDEPKRLDVIVNKVMADRFWPKQSALGKRFRPSGSDNKDIWFTVAGVVAPVLHNGVREEPPALIYYPATVTQDGDSATTRSMAYVLRGRRPARLRRGCGGQAGRGGDPRRRLGPRSQPADRRAADDDGDRRAVLRGVHLHDADARHRGDDGPAARRSRVVRGVVVCGHAARARDRRAAGARRVARTRHAVDRRAGRLRRRHRARDRPGRRVRADAAAGQPALSDRRARCLDVCRRCRPRCSSSRCWRRTCRRGARRA